MAKTKEEIEADILLRKTSRRWKLVNQTKWFGFVLTTYLAVLMVFKPEVVVNTSNIWMLVIPILFSGVSVFVGAESYLKSKK